MIVSSAILGGTCEVIFSHSSWPLFCLLSVGVLTRCKTRSQVAIIFIFFTIFLCIMVKSYVYNISLLCKKVKSFNRQVCVKLIV